MTVAGRYLGHDAQLRSFAKDQLVFEGPKALAPGAPVVITTEGEGGTALSIDARTIGSRRVSAEPLTYEIRVRTVSISRDLRLWLESTLGLRSP